MDIFDKIRSTLWKNRHEKRSIVTGCTWRPGWIGAKDGIIPKDYPDRGFGHAFKIFGQKKINGEIYLMAQLSNGKGVGDQGIFYFSREVVNREFRYGTFMFKDMDPKEARYHQDNGTRPDQNWLLQLAIIFKNFLKPW